MTPNLFLATQTLFSPHKWFKQQKSARPARKTEHWDDPVRGIYEYIPGRGWYLVATDKPKDEDAPEETPVETVKMTQPVQVKYSKVLKRNMLQPDYDMRKRYGKIKDSKGKFEEAGFFRLDDGVAWVHCWDEEGEFIPGPYKLWCIDQKSGNFRHMLKGDDPEYVHSRRNSYDRHSQDSRSTQYRSGPGSNREGPSIPSTRANSRANSLRGLTSAPTSAPTSKPASRANSRPTSPKSPGVPLSEATTLLNPIAAERAVAGRAGATSPGSGRLHPNSVAPANGE
ncbi:hypothetical protein K469DRAFT_565001 [Zopfia rhizophila CBS 207.26]|uniref:Uncharacterized protein n=1 Tax=Zopfia rhizophila CBS 207.26 TaxID=1314779 RepID=A0A6A6EEQ9_9PEZI|nr:hypothetical protein K469DRAFT_565001 [Zopfia rhizophila CBS 207.26]